VAPKHAIGLGLLLFVVYALQTWALVLTPVSRVVLITGLYAVFVPLLAPLVGLAKPTRLHWLGAGVAFAGLIGLVGAVGVDDATAVPLNFGDVLVFIHAVLSAFYILLVGRLASTADPFALNGLQLAGLAVIAVPVALLVEGTPDVAAIDGRTWLSFAYLAVFSTVVAFTSQIIGQRHVSAPTAAAIMLLETPVGVLGALLLFNEAMAPAQWIGAGVLLLGVVTSLYAEIRVTARLE
jgi:drug/metabolite transporter (DMT)-like permease